MKLTDAQRFELYLRALDRMIERAPTITGSMPAPPNKAGQSKTVASTFAVAAWAKRIADSAVYVLEGETAPAPATAPTTDSGQPADPTPF